MYRCISIWILILPDIQLKFVFNSQAKYKTQIEAKNAMIDSFNKWFLNLNKLNKPCITEDQMLKELKTDIGNNVCFEKLIHEMIQL